MGESVSKTAFYITLPIADAIKGKEISGTRAFTRTEMVSKVSSLNGAAAAKSYKVAELTIPENGCKQVGQNCIMIPCTSKATIKECHEVEDFIRQ